ncbi:MAG: N-formylglutamate amidohydrolase [Rhodobacteraceae bacterium]|nr:N-formylglutamate amidohydrolase [Paracoccaceae bacterium]
MTYDVYFRTGTDHPAPWVVTCDHAQNTVPDFVAEGDLGLPPEDMARHIAYDIGAWGVAQALATRLDGPEIGANFSRLVIDPNRGEDDPTLVMRLYDGSIIPANRHAKPEAISRCLDGCYRPYHATLTDLTARDGAVIVSALSFTRQLHGRPRRHWDIGILYALDDRLARPLLDLLYQDKTVTTGDNEPYHGALKVDAMDRHDLMPGEPVTSVNVV